MTTDTQFLSTKEVAEILGVHQKTVHHWLRTGRLAGTKISYRAWRIPRFALEEFISQNSNVHPPNAMRVQQGTDNHKPDPEKPGDIVLPQNSNTSFGTGMKHYIRDIMGENSNGQTNNE
jgi:excisionase family DNA binding protein